MFQLIQLYGFSPISRGNRVSVHIQGNFTTEH